MHHECAVADVESLKGQSKPSGLYLLLLTGLLWCLCDVVKHQFFYNDLVHIIHVHCKYTSLNCKTSSQDLIT